MVIGSGDAGIENALGLAADPAQANVVIDHEPQRRIRPRQAGQCRPADGGRRRSGRVTILCETDAGRVVPGFLYMETPRRRAEDQLRPDHRPHGLVAAAQVRRGNAASSSPAPTRIAYPALSPQFETTVPGIYVIGALAGYPLIKHCMNQGYDVGRVHQRQCRAEARRRADPRGQVPGPAGRRAASPNGSAFLRRRRRRSCNELSMLQMREFMLDSEVAGLPRRARSCSSATIPAPRCSRSPTARRWSRSIRTTARSPRRSRRARSSARSA